MSNTRKSPVRLLIVLTLSVVSLVVLWVVFEVRYIWYLNESTTTALRSGFALLASGILLSLFVAASRSLVGVLGLLAMLFPSMLGLSDTPINLGFLLFLAFAVGLLIVTAHLRRKML